MNLRRRQPRAQGQELAKGVMRPPVTTEHQAERSLDPSLQNRANAQERRIQQLIGEASHHEVEAANLRLDLAQADKTIAAQAEELADWANRFAELERINIGARAHASTKDKQWQAATAELATVRDSLHRTIRDMQAEIERLSGHATETRRPPLTATPDPQPTGPLPLMEGGSTAVDRAEDYWWRQRYDDMHFALYGDLQQAEPDATREMLTPWQTGAWVPRSSAGQNSPLVGES